MFELVLPHLLSSLPPKTSALIHTGFPFEIIRVDIFGKSEGKVARIRFPATFLLKIALHQKKKVTLDPCC